MGTDNPHSGSTFEDFLTEEGIHEEATAHAVGRVLAWQVEEATKTGESGGAEVAGRTGAGRARPDRPQDPAGREAGLHAPGRPGRNRRPRGGGRRRDGAGGAG